MLRSTIQSTAELDKTVDNFKEQGKDVIALFTGNKTENGKSWCPDCVVADPVIESSLEKLKNNDNFVFLTVPVGTLPE